MAMTPLEIAKVAAAAADDKKATDIILLDLTGISDVTDYFLICTAQNNPQMDAVVQEIRDKVAQTSGLKPISVEGRQRSNWIVIDYGSLVAHVFKPETRDYFRLERLWGDAPWVKLNLDGAAEEPLWKDDSSEETSRVDESADD